MFVLDTNTLIYFFKGMGNVSRHLLATPPKEIGIPAIVLFELQYGIARSSSPEKRIAQLKEMCTYATVLAFGEAESIESAAIRVALEKRGQPIGPFDLLIAGTARAHRGVLVTNNVSEFSRVPGLTIVNWYT